jgi:hypothetical protein
MKIFIKFFLLSFVVITQAEASHRALDILATSSYRFGSKLRFCPAFRLPTLLSTSRPLMDDQKRPTSSHVVAMDESFAKATTDTAFKHMFSPTEKESEGLLISFLNAFVPAFREEPVTTVSVMPTAIPVLPRTGQKQTFMDLHVQSDEGNQYIVEIQARRHVMFDERALYYATSVYSRQVTEKHFKDENWYLSLRPVIAVQVLDYDTNRIRGIEVKEKKGRVSSTERKMILQHANNNEISYVEHVADLPMQKDQFMKHYMLTDSCSGQQIDYLQLLQIELPRAKIVRDISKKNKKEFNDQDWWIDILVNSDKYTLEEVKRMHYQERVMPELFYRALGRLDMKRWNTRMIKEYKDDLIDKEKYSTVLAVERSEGRKEGLLQAARVMKEFKTMTDADIATKLELEEAEVAAIDIGVAAPS